MAHANETAGLIHGGINQTQNYPGPPTPVCQVEEALVRRVRGHDVHPQHQGLQALDAGVHSQVEEREHACIPSVCGALG